VIWPAIRGFFNIPRSAGVVLLYHRVATLERDPQLLAVRPEVFDAHLDMLRRRAAVLPLGELVETAARGRLPRRAVSITFDDGYADNLQNAKGILSSHRTPATLFAVSGAVSHQIEFWWDTLERALLGTDGRATLELTLGAETLQWELDGSPAHDREWNVLCPYDPTPRHHVYRELMARVKALSPALRRSVLGEMARQLGVPAGPVEGTRPLTEDEVRNMAEDGLVEIGAHSVSHPRLSSLGSAEQLQEMRASKLALESMLGRRVSAFAYPYGSQSDYTPESASLAAEAGFAWACANVPGLVRQDVDRMQIPRVLVRDVPAAALERQLEHAFAGRF